ncbi:hypothetical protein Trydic_g3474 [Trypoxylus dichotomus]
MFRCGSGLQNNAQITPGTCDKESHKGILSLQRNIWQNMRSKISNGPLAIHKSLSTITHVALVWWHKANQDYAVKILDKVQRIACLGLIWTIASGPMAGMEIILVLPPLQLVQRSEATPGAY